jgi:hypothetical protein
MGGDGLIPFHSIAPLPWHCIGGRDYSISFHCAPTMAHHFVSTDGLFHCTPTFSDYAFRPRPVSVKLLLKILITWPWSGAVCTSMRVIHFTHSKPR